MENKNNMIIRSLIYKYNKAIILLLWAIAAYLYLEGSCHYTFFHREQDQLFLMSREYITHYLDSPAWLACLLGDFLTQFFYYLYAGAAITTFSLLIFGHFLYTSLASISQDRLWRNCMFAFSIICITVGAYICIQAEQHIHSMLSLIIGTMTWLCCDLFHRIIKSYVARCIAIIFAFIFSFWAVGYGCIAIISMESIWCINKGKKNIKKLATLLLPLSLLFVYAIEGNILAKNYGVLTDEVFRSPRIDYTSDRGLSEKKEALYAYDNEYYFGNYGKVIDMYENTGGEKMEEMCFFYCLSLAQANMLPDKLMTIKNPNLGTFLKIDEKTPMFTIKMINELYFLIGDMTYTERAALLANTFSKNGRNTRMIKRIAEANLINGDTIAATKYLRLLEKSIVYKNWARNHMPGSMSPDVKQEIERKSQFVNKSDNIRIGDDCYIILTQLLDSNKDNIVALDYLLCSDIVARQRETFMRDYEKYGPRNKQLYQQALNQ